MAPSLPRRPSPDQAHNPFVVYLPQTRIAFATHYGGRLAMCLSRRDDWNRSPVQPSLRDLQRDQRDGRHRERWHPCRRFGPLRSPARMPALPVAA